MEKVKCNILLDGNVRQKAKDLGINISTFTELKLREYISLIGETNKPPQKLIWAC